MTLTTPALLFPAISLLLLAYSQRFLVIAQLIRQLHAKESDKLGDLVVRQIDNLRKRIALIKNMQLCGSIDVTGGTLNANGPITQPLSAGSLINGGALNAAAGIDVFAGDINLLDGDLNVTGGAFLPREAVDYDYDITGGGEVTAVDSVTIADSNISSSLMVSGSGSSLTVSGLGSLKVGGPGRGNLSISNGAAVHNVEGVIGSLSGLTSASAQVSGSGSLWQMSGSLSVGNTGLGVLEITAGGVVSNINGSLAEGSSSGAIATITGTGSSWQVSDQLAMGQLGDAMLNLFDGGEVTSGSGLIGQAIGGMADVLVDGNGTQWLIAQSLSLQRGSITIQNGGLVSLGNETFMLDLPENEILVSGGRFEFGSTTLDIYERINFTSGSLAGVVDLPGTNAVPDLALFHDSPGDISEVFIANSGLLFGAGTLEVSLENTPTGELEVITGERMRFEGAGPNNNDGQITLAGGQVHFFGSLANNAAGLVLGNGSLRADAGMMNDGEMAFSATANVIGDVTNNAAGLITSSGGTTTFFDDVVNDGEIQSDANSFTVYFGSYSGNGDTGTGTVIMKGDLKPGSSPGLMTFDGDLTFGNNATLEIELAGLVAGDEYDQVAVAGDIALSGDLVVSQIDGFTPLIGDSFTIVTAASVSGIFDTISLPGSGFELLYTATDVVLIATSALSGDYNNDGIVDLADYTVWRNNLGSPSGTLLNDPIGGVIDADQYAAWKTNFGATLQSAATTNATVPEPNTCMLSAMFALMIIYHYRNV